MSIAAMIAKASACSGYSPAELRGPGREQRLARTRFAICWVARKKLGSSFPVIGQALGDRDHTSIMYAYKRAEELRGASALFRDLCDEVAA